MPALTWTDEQVQDVIALTPRQFQAKYPGVHSDGSIYVKRKLLRDAGMLVPALSRGRPPERPLVQIPDLPPAPSDDELWAAYDLMYDYTEKFDASKAMHEVDITVETDRPFGICFMSDFHLGNKGTDTRQLREDIELINTCDHLQVYLGGDGIDNFILPALANVHRDESLATLEMQIQLFQSIVNRLAPSLLAVGTGNHDAWTKKLAGIDGTAAALAGIPTLFTGEDTFLNLTVGQQTYVIYRKHRPPTSSRNDQGAGVKFMFRYGTRPFDVGVQEHYHTPSIQSFRAHNEERWAITTGSYKIQDGHAREYGFVNGGIGTPVVVFHPYKKLVVPMMSIASAIAFLEID